MRHARWLGSAVLTLAAIPAAAAPAERWIHVRVDDAVEKVRVNVPLSLVERVLPLIHDAQLRGGKISLHQVEHPDVDLKALWSAVRGAPDGDFVTVRGKDQNVRVASRGGFLLIEADEPGRQESVRVRVPLAAADALFAASGEEIDLVAAIRALAGASPQGDLVTVSEGQQTVRIWVDADPTSR